MIEVGSMWKVKDLVKGQLYNLKCPVSGYELKPFIFDKLEFGAAYFIGVQSPSLVVPLAGFYDSDTNRISYTLIDASPLTPLEVELL